MYELHIILSIFTSLHTLGLVYKKTYLKTDQNIRTGTGDSQVSGHCGEEKHRGFAVLVGLIVKLSA